MRYGQNWWQQKKKEDERSFSTGHQISQMARDLHLLNSLHTMMVADQLMVVMGNVVHRMDI